MIQTVNDRCNLCPIFSKDTGLCSKTLAFKLAEYRKPKTEPETVLPRYSGSGLWDRSKRKRGIRSIAQIRGVV